MTSAAGPRGAESVKLPLWDTIRRSYASYFSNFLDVLRISWFWIIVIAPLQIVATWQQHSWNVRVVADAYHGAKVTGTLPGLSDLALGGVYILIFVLAILSIAVAWHRCIILGEHPRSQAKACGATREWDF